VSNQKLGRQLESLERLLAYVLGVAPWEFGLMPDDEGWFSLKEVMAAIRDQDGFRSVTEGRLMEIHRQPGGSSPLEMGEGAIRLKAGRAEAADPGEAPAAKPKVLHLCLKPTSWPHVSANGLAAKPGERQARLFDDTEAALTAARRLWPEPVAVSLNVRQAEAGGARITWYAPGMWRAPSLKAEWLSGPPTPPKAEDLPERPGPKPATKLPGAGAELWAAPPAAEKGKKKGKYDDAPAWKTSTRKERRKGQD
jgi:putative RNA 2'-phosphotransferase